MSQHPSQYQSAPSTHAQCQPIRRVACHHCGNIRKSQVKCVACPQLYCKNCAEKMRVEHGHQIFADGCPVCLKLCCCADKSVYCQRSHHCYRKCPVSKSGVCSSHMPPTMSPREIQVEICTPSSSSSEEASQLVTHTCTEAIVSAPSPLPPTACDSLDLLAAACAQLAEIPSKKEIAAETLVKAANVCSTGSETSSEDVSDLSSSSSGEEDILTKQKKRPAKRKCPPSSYPLASTDYTMFRQQQQQQLYQQQLAALHPHLMSTAPPQDWTSRAWPGGDIYRAPNIILPSSTLHYRMNNADWWAHSGKTTAGKDTVVWIPTLLPSSDAVSCEPSKRARTLSPEEISAMIMHQQRMQLMSAHHQSHPLSSAPHAFSQQPQLHHQVLMANHHYPTAPMPAATMRHGYGLPPSVAAAAVSSLSRHQHNT